MATKYIEQNASPAASYTGMHAGIGVDTDTREMKFNSDGTIRTVVDTTNTQTLAGKTITGPEPTETVAATNVITAAESGTTFFLSAATEFVSTLPAPAAGLRYSFIVANAPETASYTIVTNGSSNIILGQIYTVDVDSATNPEFVTAGVDTITFVDSKAVIGDRVDVICDGTNWFAYGFCSVFDAITFDTAS